MGMQREQGFALLHATFFSAPPCQKGLGACGLELRATTPCCAFPLLCTDRDAFGRWPSSQPTTFFPFSPKLSIHARMLHPWSYRVPCGVNVPVGGQAPAVRPQQPQGKPVSPWERSWSTLCVPETTGHVIKILNPERLSHTNRLFLLFGPFT